jgi:hypothetical protein
MYTYIHMHYAVLPRYRSMYCSIYPWHEWNECRFYKRDLHLGGRGPGGVLLHVVITWISPLTFVLLHRKVCGKDHARGTGRTAINPDNNVFVTQTEELWITVFEWRFSVIQSLHSRRGTSPPRPRALTTTIEADLQSTTSQEHVPWFKASLKRAVIQRSTMHAPKIASPYTDLSWCGPSLVGGCQANPALQSHFSSTRSVYIWRYSCGL